MQPAFFQILHMLVHCVMSGILVVEARPGGTGLLYLGGIGSRHSESNFIIEEQICFA